MMEPVSPEPIRILLANAPRLMRELLSRYLNKQDDLHVVAEVADLNQLAQTVGGTTPHALVATLEANGTLDERVRMVQHTYPDLQVLALSHDARRVYDGVKSQPLWLEHPDDLLALIRTHAPSTG